MLVKIEQNRMVPTIQDFVLFDKKWLTIFAKMVGKGEEALETGENMGGAGKPFVALKFNW